MEEVVAVQTRPTLICWRRIDVIGLELLALRMGTDEVRAESSIICTADGGFRLDHAWRLTQDWRAVSVQIERRDAEGSRTLTVMREGDGWRVDGKPRPDLDGTVEPDLSATPFCNTLVIRRVPAVDGASLT